MGRRMLTLLRFLIGGLKEKPKRRCADVLRVDTKLVGARDQDAGVSEGTHGLGLGSNNTAERKAVCDY